MIELEIDRIATGGDGVGREASGRVVFVHGGLPGDVVLVELVREKKKMAWADIVEVVRPSPMRVVAPCPHVTEGCGGCDLQHASAQAQRQLKLSIVTDTLQRLGKIGDVVPTFGGAVAEFGYRTTVKASVVDDQAGFFRRRSKTVIPTPDCQIAHPALRDVLREERFSGQAEVVLRVSTATGDIAVSAAPASGAVGMAHSGSPIEEVACGRTWRLSPGTFFQSCPGAVELLVDAVAPVVAAAPEGPLVDLYGGVGVFAGALGAGRKVTVVEANVAACADAAFNLGSDATVVASTVEAWKPTPAAVVIADPPRAGLGRAGVDVVLATGAPAVALVACDPASFARDARLLVDAGMRLESAVVFDLFPQTSHVEVVGAFGRPD